MRKNSGGFSFVLILIIISLSMLLGLVVLNKQNYIQKNIEINTTNLLLNNNISNKSKLILNNAYSLNSYVSCPNLVNILSGSTLLYTGSTYFYNSGSTYFCSGVLNSKVLNLFYSGGISFSSGTYNSTNFTLNLGIGNIVASGSLSGTSSLNFNYNTNDFLVNKEVFGFANTGVYKNIFWNNYVINNYLSGTSNLVGKEIGLVSSGAIFFNIGGTGTLKIVEFDRNKFTSGTLMKNSEQSINFSGSINGYLQSDNSFSNTLSNAKYFDFKNRDYAIFLKPTNNNITYNIKVNDISGSGVYFNPVKILNNQIEYLSNDIVLYNSGFIFKLNKIVNVR